MRHAADPVIVKCTAPIRICDLGGWTDTWFAGEGKIVNIAVFPPVEVTVSVTPREPGASQITVFAENYRDSYDLPQEPGAFTKHPLIEAACRAFEFPEHMHLDVAIYSEAPAGASTGTSASVSVAVIAALDQILSRSLTSYEIARKSHYLETEVLGLQSGIQDQLCAAYGGINFIEMDDYPKASVSPLLLSRELLWDLESRLILIYLGKPHSSSEVHKTVIQRLEESPQFREKLQPLRECALRGKSALLNGDLAEFGRTMIDNTNAQRELHPELVGERAQLVIDAAERFGVEGWKVNGAGGSGGSVTVLLKPGMSGKHRFREMVQKLHPEFQDIPVRLAPQGLCRWKA